MKIQVLTFFCRGVIIQEQTAKRGGALILGGEGTGSGTIGGVVTIRGGRSSSSTPGGVIIQGGQAIGGTNRGGDVRLSGGASTGGARKGKVYIDTQFLFKLGTFTTAQRDALVSLEAGDAIYNTTLSKYQGYNGSGWVNLQEGGFQTLTPISPSSITANQDDYNPGSLSTAGVIYVSSSDIFQIRGLSGGSDGIVRTFVNTGSFPIIFPAENAGSTAANRFLGSSDVILYPGKPIAWVYNGSESRWRLFSTATDADFSYSRIIHRAFRGGSNTAADWGDLGFTVSGTGATTSAGTATSTNPFSYYQMQTGTTTTGLAAFGFSKTVSQAWNGTTYRKSKAMILLPVLSDATNTYQAAFREAPTLATTTTSPNNTAGIRYSLGTNSGKWECYTRNNAGSETVLDSGVTVAANTVYSMEIIVDKAGTEYRFYINGTYIGAITATLPNTGAAVIAHAIINKSAGTTNTSLHVLGGSQLQLN